MITIRLPEQVAAQIALESRQRRISKSDVVRERLRRGGEPVPRAAALEAIGDLVGSVDELPSDLSERKKAYLRTKSYGRKRPR